MRRATTTPTKCKADNMLPAMDHRSQVSAKLPFTVGQENSSWNSLERGEKNAKQTRRLTSPEMDATKHSQRPESHHRNCIFENRPSTHSLPQSNLAVMCCLTSLMRSWVRWPTSTCLLRSRISFITCQSRWNKSPSFFCRSRARWDGKETGRQNDKKKTRNEEDRLVGIWLQRCGGGDKMTEFGIQSDGWSR